MNFSSNWNWMGKVSFNLPKLYSSLFFLLVFYVFPCCGQGGPTSPCEEQEHTFTGVKGATLCNEFGDMEIDLTIGMGSGITYTSQIGSSFSGKCFYIR